MEWFNIYGLGIICVIMIPNIIFALKNREGCENKYKNRTLELLEQTGRFASIAFMVFNLPAVTLGYWFNEGFAAYIAINGILCAAYCLLWALLWRKRSVFRALALYILPAALFILPVISKRYLYEYPSQD